MARARPAVGISIECISWSQMALLNERNKCRMGPTDVLSFPNEFLIPAGENYHDAARALLVVPPAERTDLGAMFVCPEYIVWKAGRFPSRMYDADTWLEVAFVHGVLHLLGHRHETDLDHATMVRSEKNVLSALKRQWRRGVVPPLHLPNVS